MVIVPFVSSVIIVPFLPAFPSHQCRRDTAVPSMTTAPFPSLFTLRQIRRVIFTLIILTPQ
jgi:hypothetical protein